jgi:hypothetical protein
MKNLPDKFPIRHALILEDFEYDETNEELNYNNARKRNIILFNQYLLSLQNNGVTVELALPKYQQIKFSLSNIEVINISVLNPKKNWVDESKEKIPELMPNLNFSGSSIGDAFSVGIYSYEGAYEIPAFINFYNTFKKENGRKNTLLKFGKDSNISNFFYNKFLEIKNGKLNNLDLFKISNKYNKPIYIKTKYTSILDLLDSEFSSGVIPTITGNTEKISFISTIKNDKKDIATKQIEILVCKSWEELFMEELNIIYKNLTFCQNCGKALPKNYRGDYCVDSPENKECIKERNRKRKSQSKN